MKIRRTAGAATSAKLISPLTFNLTNDGFEISQIAQKGLHYPFAKQVTHHLFIYKALRNYPYPFV